MSFLEILIAMLVLAMVTGGIFGAFFFARQMSYRSEGTLLAQVYAQRVAERIRASIGSDADPKSRLPLVPGIYLDPDYDEDGNPGNEKQNPPAPCDNAPAPIRLENLPPGDSLRIPSDLKKKYNLRWRYYVEDSHTATAPYPDCLHAPRGLDFNKDGNTDLTWTDIRVDWTPPAS